MLRQADRVLGGALAAVGAVVIWHAQTLDVPFAADPVGPRAFPTAVALVLIACSALMAARPGVTWERAERALPGPVAVAAMLAYALLLAPLGFIPATFLLCLSIALAFGARPLQALASGAITAPLLWLLLDRALDLPLPRGVFGI